MKNSHGGKREGAGRKSESPTGKNRVKMNITVDPEDYEQLQGLDKRQVFDLGLGVAIPAVKGKGDEARDKLDDFLNE